MLCEGTSKCNEGNASHQAYWQKMQARLIKAQFRGFESCSALQ